MNSEIQEKSDKISLLAKVLETIQNKPRGKPVYFNKYDTELGVSIVLICDKQKEDYLRFISTAKERGIELIYLLARGNRICKADEVVDSLVKMSSWHCFLRKEDKQFYEKEGREVDCVLIGITHSEQLADSLQEKAEEVGASASTASVESAHLDL